MPFKIKALEGLDMHVVGYGAAIVLSIAGVVMLTLQMGKLEAAATEGQDELAGMERQAEAIVLPTDEERARWSTDQNLMASMLLADAEIPALLQDVTRLATLNQLGRFELATEEFVIADGAELSPDQALMQSVGILRHITVTVGFSADYRNVAEFVRDVGNLPRLVEFVSVQLTRQPSTISVTMSFRVYQSETAA